MKSRRVQLLWAGVAVPVTVVLFCAYLRLSTRDTVISSDGASQALQAWDMLHGNWLLHGWAVTDVSFYTTELPEYMLLEGIRGLTPDVMHVAGALTYTLLVLLAALTAKGRAAGREGVARALVAAGIMLAPQPGIAPRMLLAAPDHVGTAVPVLLTWLIVDRAGGAARQRARMLSAAAAGLLLAWTMIADPLAGVIGAAPLALVSGGRAYRALVMRREPASAGRYELCLAGAALAAWPVSVVATRLIAVAGGWTATPVRTAIAPAGMIPQHLLVTGEGLLEMFGAYFGGLPMGRAATVFAVLHLAGLALACWGLWLAVRRFFAAELLVQGVVVAIGLNLAAYVLTVQVQGIATTREIAPVLPLAAVLAGRLTAGRLLAARLAPAMGGTVLTMYAGMLLVSTVQPPVPTPGANISSWLAARHLTHGLGGYWQANLITLDSGGTVQVRAVAINRGMLTNQGYWNAERAWYRPATQYADFLVSPATNSWRFQRLIVHMAAEAGRPAHIYKVGPYTIAVWNRNLLARLH
jgi:hypothetical protein